MQAIQQWHWTLHIQTSQMLTHVAGCHWGRSAARHGTWGSGPCQVTNTGSVVSALVDWTGHQDSAACSEAITASYPLTFALQLFEPFLEFLKIYRVRICQLKFRLLIYLPCNKQLTKTIEPSPSRDVKSCCHSGKFIAMLRGPANELSWARWIQSTHTTCYLFMIFNIILPFISRSFKGFLPFRFFKWRFFMHLWFLSYMLHAASLYPHWFDYSQ